MYEDADLLDLAFEAGAEHFQAASARQAAVEHADVRHHAAVGVADLLKAGVVDPAKVTRSALQNAASIAGLLLTTDCMVTDLPEKKESCGCGGHGAPGGMDGMM